MRLFQKLVVLMDELFLFRLFLKESEHLFSLRQPDLKKVLGLRMEGYSVPFRINEKPHESYIRCDLFLLL